MNIEVGDYIRTKHNGIKKVIRINEKATKNKYVVYYGIDKEGDKTYITINIDDVINSSKNLIDLIEVGDIVNKEKVYYTKDNFPAFQDKANENDIIFTQYIDEYGEWYGYENLSEKDTILTHEQYEQNCYKVEA